MKFFSLRGPWGLAKIGTLITLIAGGLLAISHPESWSFPLQVAVVVGSAFVTIGAGVGVRESRKAKRREGGLK